MKRFEFSSEKNALVKKQHGISFEEVIDALESKKILAAFPHPNHNKYPNQMMMVIEVKGYAYGGSGGRGGRIFLSQNSVSK
ncbi:MAG: hypothetical protein AAB557_05220 [Patescibacteria group bacterium]